MSTAAPAAAAAAATAAGPAPNKAILLLALQQRLAALQKTVGQQKQSQTAASTPPPAAVAAAAASPSPSPPSALEMAKAMLAAKIAAKEAAARGSPSPSPSPSPLPLASAANAAAGAPVLAAAGRPSNLSVQAAPFFPASAAAASTAGLSTAAAAAPGSAAPRGAIALHKTQLCRSWLTCTFGAKCRFRHPQVDVEPFFEYGGDVLLHLNAANAVALPNGPPIADSSAYASPSSMPPVLLLILTLILQAGPAAEGGPALLPLMQLWSSLREQLSGCKELPANQDDMLNVMGLPTTAAVVQRAAEGQTVLSTEAFRNMYACVFSIRRDAATFVVTHQWDEERRARLQAALDAQQQSRQRAAQARAAPPPSSTNQAYALSHAAAAASDDDNRKRKRVPDAELNEFGGSNKQRRLGEAYPEEQDLAVRPAFKAAQSLPPVGGHYSLDAGEEMGGSTAFVRGGIVTELSLLGQQSAAAAARAQQQQAYQDDDDFGDAFTRAIRRQQQVQTQATYTVPTRRITSGKGFDMLQRMNWRHGQGLGKRKQGRVDPVEVKFRADRAGL